MPSRASLGVRAAEIQRRAQGISWQIRGGRSRSTVREEENIYRWERSYGSFFRRLPLNFEVKAEDVKASFENGVLEVTLPLPKEGKREKVRKIAVN